MKHLVAIALAVICLPAICLSTPEEDVLCKARERYPWLPQEVKITKSKPLEPQEDRYYITTPKSDQSYFVDTSGFIVYAEWNMRSDPKVFPERDENFVWSQRPDIPRNKMVKYGQNFYRLKRLDGLIDARVELHVVESGGVVRGFTARNDLDSRTIPSVKISKAKARQVAERYLKSYVGLRTRGLSQAQAVYWPHQFLNHEFLDDAAIRNDSLRNLFVDYEFYYKLSVKPVTNPDKLGDPEIYTYPMMFIRVNATTGDIIQSRFDTYKVQDVIWGLPTDKPASKPASIAIELNTWDQLWGNPCIFIDARMYIPLMALQSLAKPHIVEAHAGDGRFTLNGAKIELSAKVVDHKGILYLPWQSINSLPGCKAEFDAEGYMLKITTPALKDTVQRSK